MLTRTPLPRPSTSRATGLAAAVLLALAASALSAVAPASASGPAARPLAEACGNGTGDTEAVQSGNTWTAKRGGTTLYTGSDTQAAIRAAINGLTAGRSSKQRVVVRGSGTVSASSAIDLPSHTTIDVCGTLTSQGTPTANTGILRARKVTDVEIQHVNIAGDVYFGIYIANSTNVTMGTVNSNLGKGIGIRIDNYADKSQWTKNIKLDTLNASNGTSHGLETYGVDGIQIGTVVARNTGECGVLLNQTVNATIGTVDADGAGKGTGYAGFRIANRAGYVNGSWPTNIKVGKVIAHGGGRGIFCVSESGGLTVDTVDVANTGNNAILLENCHNVVLAATSGTVTGGGEVRIASRTEFPASSDIRLQNLRISGTPVTLNPCGTNNTYRNLTLSNAKLTWC